MSKTIKDGLSAGFLAQSGQYGADDIATICELLESISASELETVRLVFADQHGVFRGKTITTAALESAFVSGIGVPSTLLLKDTSQKTVFPVWEEETGGGCQCSSRGRGFGDGTGGDEFHLCTLGFPFRLDIVRYGL